MKMLLQDLQTNSKDLPDHIKAKTGGHILDMKKVAIFQLLQSLNRRNIRRLLERPQERAVDIQSGFIRSTRKNLRDLLSNFEYLLY